MKKKIIKIILINFFKNINSERDDKNYLMLKLFFSLLVQHT